MLKSYANPSGLNPEISPLSKSNWDEVPPASIVELETIAPVPLGAAKTLNNFGSELSNCPFTVPVT